MREINASIAIDKRLWREDIAASRAHAAMLGRQGILSEADARAIDEGLAAVAARDRRRQAGRGSRARRHSHARRASPVRADRRARRAAPHRAQPQRPGRDRLQIVRPRRDRRSRSRDRRARSWPCSTAPKSMPRRVMPGFTHLQSGQPVTLGHHLLAYREMLVRDRSRFADARARMNECPLGSAALAGTGFDLDRDDTARRARLRPPDREQHRCGQRPRLRRRLSPRRRAHRRASVAAGRGNHPVGVAAVRLRALARRLVDRIVDHAQQAQPRRRRAGARASARGSSATSSPCSCC